MSLIPPTETKPGDASPAPQAPFPPQQHPAHPGYQQPWPYPYPPSAYPSWFPNGGDVQPHGNVQQPRNVVVANTDRRDPISRAHEACIGSTRTAVHCGSCGADNLPPHHIPLPAAIVSSALLFAVWKPLALAPWVARGVGRKGWRESVESGKASCGGCGEKLKEEPKVVGNVWKGNQGWGME
ncbi:hypothetical protein DFJ74DRAFT_655812 [Hyaloraphidium curvatum]|nr:hypothetical protein DFJ74DRAFT_655812 [Hyaloraphidium curvatum]